MFFFFNKAPSERMKTKKNINFLSQRRGALYVGVMYKFPCKQLVLYNKVETINTQF